MRCHQHISTDHVSCVARVPEPHTRAVLAVHARVDMGPPSNSNQGTKTGRSEFGCSGQQLSYGPARTVTGRFRSAGGGVSRGLTESSSGSNGRRCQIERRLRAAGGLTIRHGDITEERAGGSCTAGVGSSTASLPVLAGTRLARCAVDELGARVSWRTGPCFSTGLFSAEPSTLCPRRTGDHRTGNSTKEGGRRRSATATRTACPMLARPAGGVPVGEGPRLLPLGRRRRHVGADNYVLLN